MRRERLKFVLDVTMLTAGIVFSTVAAVVSTDHMPSLAWVIAYPVLVLLLLVARRMYVPRLRRDLLEEARRILGATALAAMAIITLQVIRGLDEIGYEVVRPWLFTTAYLLAGRVALYLVDSHALKRGELGERTLIVGAGRIGALTARRLLEHREFGLQPVGFVDKEPLDEASLPLPVLGASWDLERLIEQHGIRHVVITFSTAPSEVLLREVERCGQLGISVSLVPRLFERITERASVEHIGGLPLLSVPRIDPKGWQFALKYAGDRVVAGLLVLLCLPVFAAAAIAVRLSIGSPILFRQPRVGRDGREFEMLKLRTMRGSPRDGEADADWADAQLGLRPSEPIVADDRTTGVGRFLRSLSIDELPQLLNVVKGDMSLVGPRPERTQYVRRFEQFVYRYGDRHRVKSGITGWAQVNGLRGRTSLSDRVEWDNYYIENWSLWLDVKIILLTCLAILSSALDGVTPRRRRR
jgi:exopolysaccharide biosynthesis polyprenyl glycosylphosphotransferase